jgi:hypothetical protein
MSPIISRIFPLFFHPLHRQQLYEKGAAEIKRTVKDVTHTDKSIHPPENVLDVTHRLFLPNLLFTDHSTI